MPILFIKAKGTIILLNGVSSSGKTTIANSLQNIMDAPYLIVGLDLFYNLYSKLLPKRFNPEPIPKTDSIDKGYALYCKCEIRNRKVETFHRFIAAFSAAGNNIIVDTIIDTKHVLENFIAILEDYPVLLVGVHCPLEELERREKARGDRTLGLAKIQYDRLHAHTLYDVEVDTSKQTPLECARKITKVIEIFLKEHFLKHGKTCIKSFQMLRNNLSRFSDNRGVI